MSKSKFLPNAPYTEEKKSKRSQKRGNGNTKGQRRWLKTRHRIRHGLLR